MAGSYGRINSWQRTASLLQPDDPVAKGENSRCNLGRRERKEGEAGGGMDFR